MKDNYVYDLWVSLKKNVDGNSRIGKNERMWYDPVSNTIRIGDGTPGGHPLAIGKFIELGETPNTYENMGDKFVKVSKTDPELVFSDIVDGGNF